MPPPPSRVPLSQALLAGSSGRCSWCRAISNPCCVQLHCVLVACSCVVVRMEAALECFDAWYLPLFAESLGRVEKGRFLRSSFCNGFHFSRSGSWLMDVCVRLHELGRERWMARAVACASRVTARLGFEPRACGVRRPRALLGDGVNREGVLRRSSRWPSRHTPARWLAHRSAAHAAPSNMLICVCSLVAQAAFDKCHSRVRHFAGVFTFAVENGPASHAALRYACCRPVVWSTSLLCSQSQMCR